MTGHFLPLVNTTRAAIETNASFITNTKNTYGSLTVKKVLAGNDKDTDKEFSFTIKLSDEALIKTWTALSSRTVSLLSP